MLDHPMQFLLTSLVIVGLVSFLWRTRRSRLPSPPVGWRRFGRATGRFALWLVVLITLLLAIDATRFMTADVCLEWSPGTEWCLHGEPGRETESATGTDAAARPDGPPPTNPLRSQASPRMATDAGVGGEMARWPVAGPA